MTLLDAVSKLAKHVCPVCGAFARVWTLPPEDGWTMIALECSVCPARAAVRLPRADALAALRGATPAGWQDFTRLTVVDESGRVYERWNVVLEPSVQDQGRTLKVFVTPHHANLSAPPEATE